MANIIQNINHKKYKVAIIGLGRIGYSLQKDKKREQPASHSSAFFKNKKTKIIAGADINNDKLILWKKDFPNANTYADYKKLLKNESPDIIVIAVNEDRHFQVAADAIKNKPKLVVLEKPVAPDLIQAKAIQKLAKEFNVPVIINHERRFSEDYIELKRILREKIIGEISSVHANLWSNNFVWNNKSGKKGTGMLLHDATHLVDIIFFLFDSSLSSPVIDKKKINKKKEIESLFFHTFSGNEILIYFDISGNKKYFGFEIEIRASLGRIVIGNGYFDLYMRKESQYYQNFFSLVKNKKFKQPGKTGYFLNMTDHCVLFMDKKIKLESTIDDGIKVLEYLYKIAGKI